MEWLSIGQLYRVLEGSVCPEFLIYSLSLFTPLILEFSTTYRIRRQKPSSSVNVLAAKSSLSTGPKLRLSMLTSRGVDFDFDSVSLRFKDALAELLSEKVCSFKNTDGSIQLSAVDEAFYFELIKSTTQSKVYVSTASKEDGELDLSRKRTKFYRLLGQEELVVKIWESITDCFDEAADQVISELIENLALESDFEAAFVQLWPDCCLGVYRNQKLLISKALKPLTDTFPFLLDKIPGVQSIADFIDYRLVEAGLSVLGNKIDRTVTEIIETLRRDLERLATADGNSGLRARIESLKMLLRVMSQCRLTVIKEQKISLQKTYINNLESMLDKLEIVVDKNYLANVRIFMVRECEISACISRNLTVKVKQAFADSLIFPEKCLRKLLNLYALCYGFRKEFELLKLTHVTSSRRQEFYDVLASEVTNRFNVSLRQHRNANHILWCCSSLYALKEPSCHSIIRASLRETFGGELRVLEPLLKSLNMIIKRCYELLKTDASEAKKYYDIQSHTIKSLFTILRDFDLTEPFFKLYLERGLLRRAFLMGQEYLTFATHQYNIERMVLDEFDSMSSLNDNFSQVSKLRDDLARTEALFEGFNGNRRGEIEIIPMIFERKNVPAFFQELPNYDIDLPPLLRQQWNRFHNYYLKSDSKAGLKPLTLENSLHHLEVQTSFPLENGSLLTLEVSLLQASVLEILDSRDEVTVSMLQSSLSVPIHQIELTLQVFVEFNLLQETDGAYKINENFIVDPKKVKNGRLRVVQRAVTKSQNRNSVFTTPEPKNANWAQEVLCATIVRSLKGHVGGMSFDELKRLTETRMLGISTGEFKSALAASDEYFTIKDDLYYYIP
ncbi:LAFA_0C01618g1_1 [Lachancea sp. 'fantastica']|nr:LAFA_0C01618g1_1 [Lachancea sp. 'fantastica']